METETKKRNGKAEGCGVKVEASTLPKSKGKYRIGRIWDAEAAELLAAFNAKLFNGMVPRAALEEIAREGGRRSEVIAGSPRCPWAHGIVPVKSKKTYSPKAVKSATPPVAPETQLILDQSNQYIKVLDQLQMLSSALVNFRESLVLVTDSSINKYACQGASTLVAMQDWIYPVQLPAIT